MPLDDFYSKILVIQNFDIEKETIQILNKYGELLQNLLKRQLGKGKDGKGENVTIFGRDYYSDATIQDKTYNGRGLGKETEYITNYMSGVFYSTIKLKTQRDEFEFDSTVDYFSEILRRSGSVIMELDADNCEFFSINYLFPELQESFNRQFNGV